MKLTQGALEQLKANLLFKQLDCDQFNSISRTAHLHHLADNELLFETGDPATDIFLLSKGRMKLVRLTRSGDEKIIDIIQPGQSFAEAILFQGGSVYPVHAVALGETSVIGINAVTYREAISKSQETCFNMMAVMSQRIHWLLNEVDRLTLHNASYRLIDFLLEEATAASDSASQQNSAIIDLTIPKHVIASRLSIKPETLSRTLKHLANEELIKVNLHQIELLDIQGLKSIINLQ